MIAKISNSIKESSKKATWKTHRRNMIINNEFNDLTKRIRENFITLIVSAFGLVSALSWNDAIKSAIATLFPNSSDLVYKFYVAVAVTIIAVLMTYFLSRVKQKR
ncbi:MAG: DUF5654 family protein [Candidatus Aenigmatarchaeota archaeon]